MFTRGMLRPSRRHAHERISQSEDANNDTGDNNNSIAEDERSEEPSFDAIGGGDGGATVAIIGDGSQSQHHHHDHDLNLTEGGAGGTDASSRPTSSSAGNQDMINSSNPRGTTNNTSSSSNNAENDEPNLEPVSSEENDDDDHDDRELEGALQPNPTTHPFLTSQIQTERELRARRQSTCTLLILFFLVRLWFEAVLEKDVGLIFLSTMGTVWTYRWFATRREAEEEYDRQIIAEERNNAGGGVAEGAGGAENNGAGSGADAAVDFDPDLGLMSFQAQLALAILESQRQMFENGGYGGNDRASNDEPGVTNEAKERWKSYEWGECVEETAKLAGMSRSSSTEAIKRTGSGGDYGSVGTVVDLNEDEGLDKSSVEGLEGGLLASFDDEEEPSCSICLCEYERGEKVIGLPCGHLYHESCLDSWTESHVRCPLCNLDLMEGFEQPANVQRAQAHAEEQRAFRHMALSTLGRRIRTRRAASRRRSERASAAAAMMAAAEDSIV